jgi:hypothetical protein
MPSARRPSLLLVALGALAVATPASSAQARPLVDAAASAAGPTATQAKVTIVRGSGNIRPAVRRFRRLLGQNNGGAPGGQASGRREIDWDAVPDRFAAPHALPGKFFNAKTAPRARGTVLATPGDHVAVSADPDNPDGAAVRFGDINPTYVNQFRTFSAPRLFSPVGSNIVNLRFRVPGTNRRAVTRGFGAVYTDVDRVDKTAFRYYDANNRLLGKFTVPKSRRGLSFLGVRFDNPVVARVRIEYGTSRLGRNDSARYDVAVMDDFIYGEPQPAPR